MTEINDLVARLRSGGPGPRTARPAIRGSHPYGQRPPHVATPQPAPTVSDSAPLDEDDLLAQTDADLALLGSSIFDDFDAMLSDPPATPPPVHPSKPPLPPTGALRPQPTAHNRPTPAPAPPKCAPGSQPAGIGVSINSPRPATPAMRPPTTNQRQGATNQIPPRPHLPTNQFARTSPGPASQQPLQGSANQKHPNGPCMAGQRNGPPHQTPNSIRPPPTPSTNQRLAQPPHPSNQNHPRPIHPSTPNMGVNPWAHPTHTHPTGGKENLPPRLGPHTQSAPGPPPTKRLRVAPTTPAPTRPQRPADHPIGNAAQQRPPAPPLTAQQALPPDPHLSRTIRDSPAGPPPGVLPPVATPVRRFPGPAGALPPREALGPDDLMPMERRRAWPLVGRPESSASDDVRMPTRFAPDGLHRPEFTQGAWQRMLDTLGLAEAFRGQVQDSHSLANTPLAYSIRYVLDQGRLCKIPDLIVLVKSLGTPSSAMAATFVDPTGEMMGIIHQKVYEAHEGAIVGGSVLVLRQVSVFNPSRKNCYLNVTLDNVVRVFPPDQDLLSSQSSRVSNPSTLPPPTTLAESTDPGSEAPDPPSNTNPPVASPPQDADLMAHLNDDMFLGDDWDMGLDV